MRKQKKIPLRTQDLEGFCSDTSFNYRNNIGDIFLGIIGSISHDVSKDGAIQKLTINAEWIVRVTDGSGPFTLDHGVIPIKGSFCEKYCMTFENPRLDKAEESKIVIIAGEDRLEISRNDLVIQTVEALQEVAIQEKAA